ncbi:MAG: hypothetical protein ACPGXL_06175 [Chitinophagales bacterium]
MVSFIFVGSSIETHFVFFGLLITICLFMASYQTANRNHELTIEASIVEENPAEVESIGEVGENPEMDAEPSGEVENISINTTQVVGD